ncbi:MAG: putative dynein heavy chain family protein, partial [Streblomastix strix]
MTSYSTKLQPDVEQPKIFAEYNPAPGKVPRKILIERTKKLWNSKDIEALLRVLGIDYSVQSDPKNVSKLLPLEAFDNSDFDDRFSIDWINMGKRAEAAKLVDESNADSISPEERKRIISRLHRMERRRLKQRYGKKGIGGDDEELPDDVELSDSEEAELMENLTEELKKQLKLGQTVEDNEDREEDEEYLKPLTEGQQQVAVLEDNDSPELQNELIVKAPVPVPARAARFSDNGTAVWEDCDVVSLIRIPPNVPERTHSGDLMSEKQKKKVASAMGRYIQERFDVRWRSDQQISQLPRIHICFRGEDPEKFVLRVLWAHKKRNEASLQLNYTLCQQSMPTDDVSLPSTESLQRIIQMSTLCNFSKLHRIRGQPMVTVTGDKDVGQQTIDEDTDNDLPIEKRTKLERVDKTGVMQEVTSLHCQAMNKLIFDIERKEKKNPQLFEDIELPPEEKEKEIPEQGTVETPPHNMADSKNKLMEQSFLTKPQVVGSLFHIRAECDGISNQRLFCIKQLKGRTLQLDDMSNMQTQTCTSLVSFLNDKWMMSVKQAVVNALQNVGKQWFNGQEDNIEQYEISKLRKFFTTVTFMMQDSLKMMMQQSVEEYTSFFEQLTPQSVVVNGMNDVQVTFKPPRIRRGEAKKIIQQLELEKGKLQDTLNSKNAQSPQSQNPSDEKADDNLLVTEASQRLKSLRRVTQTPQPLLFVDIEWIAEEGVHSVVPLDRYRQMPLQMFDQGVESCQEFVRLEAQLMPRLFKARKEAAIKHAAIVAAQEEAKKQAEKEAEKNGPGSRSLQQEQATTQQQQPEEEKKEEQSKEQLARELRRRQQQLGVNTYLAVLDFDDAYTQERFNRVRATLEKSVEPLQQYIKTYESLNEILAVNIEEFAKTECRDERSPQDCSEVIKRYQIKAKDVEGLIPDEVYMGLFLINCAKLKSVITKKYTDIAKAMINTLGRRVMNQASTLIEKYQEILRILTEKPKSPEELVQKREYLKTIPRELTNLQPDLDSMKLTYDTLEQFDYKFSDEEFRKHWSGYGWARTILGECDETEENLKRYQKIFEEQLVSNQEKFVRQLQDAIQQTNRLNRHSDFTRVYDVFQEVTRLSTTLDDMKKKLKEFNQNEGLLGREITEYPELQQTSKKFEGYYLLWTTANN